MVSSASKNQFVSAKALVVDDEEENRLFLSLLLQENNYEVIEAKNGQEAIDLFITHKPDIVFMDIIMPVKDGYQATREIRAHSRDDFIPIIFTTALSDVKDLEKCIEAGGDDFITKPIDLNILKSKIQSLARIRGIYRRLSELTQAQNTDRELSERMLKRAIFAKNTHIESIKSWFQTEGQINNDIFLVMHTPGNSLNILLGNFNLNSSAAAVGALPCSEVFRSMTQKGFSSGDIIDGINKKLIDILPAGIHMGAIFINIDERFNQIQICNLGMPDIFIVSDESNSIKRTISSSPNLLGQDENLDAKKIIENVEIGKNNRLILLGNGISQIQNLSNEKYESERLNLAVIDGIKNGNILETIKSDLISFSQANLKKQALSIVEIPCNSELLLKESQLISEIQHNKKTSHKKINSKNSIVFELQINGKNLRHVDPVPSLINFLQELSNIKNHQESLFTIFTELYINALDHGILGLKSSLKNSPDGFTTYFEQREKKLESLDSGHVKIKLSLESNEILNRLDIFIEDSGPGFDFENVATKPHQTSNLLSGRGITLIMALCDSVEFHKPGNQSTSVYSWPNE